MQKSLLLSLCCVEVIATADEAVAFDGIDAALLVGAMPRREGMERKDLLAANVKIFKSQGAALDKYAKKSVKVWCVDHLKTSLALTNMILFMLSTKLISNGFLCNLVVLGTPLSTSDQRLFLS